MSVHVIFDENAGPDPIDEEYAAQSPHGDILPRINGAMATLARAGDDLEVGIQALKEILGQSADPAIAQALDNLGQIAQPLKERARDGRAATIDLEDRLTDEDLWAEITDAENNALQKDPLTGAYNRHFFNDAMTHLIDRAQDTDTSLYAVMVDADHFKQVNDNHGHDSGDEVLKILAGQIQSSVRDVDLVARFGGEEFVVLIPDATKEEAASIAERIRSTVESRGEERGRNGVFAPAVTVSIGMAAWQMDEEDIAPALKRADEALYQAKESGRNRVVCAADQGSKAFGASVAIQSLKI